MKTVVLAIAAVALSGCGSSTDEVAPSDSIGPGTGLGPGLWTLGERSGLCAASNDEAAFVIYGENDTNCMAQGTIEAGEGGGLAFAPRGDADCRIPIEDLGQSIRLGDGGQACAYYCGGEARYAGRELVKRWDEKPDLRDAAGEGIC